MPYQTYEPHNESQLVEQEEDNDSIESLMYKLCELKIYIGKDNATRDEGLRDAGRPPNIDY
jgi:hypothetical protein